MWILNQMEWPTCVSQITVYCNYNNYSCLFINACVLNEHKQAFMRHRKFIGHRKFIEYPASLVSKILLFSPMASEK